MTEKIDKICNDLIAVCKENMLFDVSPSVEFLRDMAKRDAMCAETATEKLRGVITDCQNLLAAWIVPDSKISNHQVLNDLLGILDGSQTRDAMRAQETEAAQAGDTCVADIVSPESAAAPAVSGGEVIKSITDYLTCGGLFNPELANHGSVRDLLIDCRTIIEQLQARIEEAADHVHAVDEENFHLKNTALAENVALAFEQCNKQRELIEHLQARVYDYETAHKTYKWLIETEPERVADYLKQRDSEIKLRTAAESSLTAARAELEGCKRDAERYRWIREIGTDKGIIDWYALAWTERDLDAVVDAALKARED